MFQFNYKIYIKCTVLIMWSAIRVCCCSVTQSWPTLCGPMDCSMPDLPILHHLLEFAQIHIHCIGDAIQPSHPLTPSSSALNLSLHTLLAWEMSTIVQWLHLQTWGTHLLVSYLLAFYTVHEVLTASILGWFAIPSSNGSRFVRTVRYDPSVLGGPTWHGS